ncbi:PAAR domain-containing protein, partial [Photorhabdus sp. P32]
VEGSNDLKHQGKPIALEGMQTACGAKLIASQKDFLA